MGNRKKNIIFMLLLIIFIYLFSGSVEAYRRKEIKVYINGDRVYFDIPPMKVKNKIMVPVKILFEKLGATVEINSLTKTIEINRYTDKIRLNPGEKIAYVNGHMRYMSAPASIIGGRLMVPLRFVEKSFGSEVRWVNSTRAIYISDPNAPPFFTTKRKITGTLLKVYISRYPNTISVRKGSRVYVFDVTDRTEIYSREILGGFEGFTNLREIFPGDEVTVTTGGSSYKAIKIECKYRLVKGIVSSRSGRNIFLKSGEFVTLSPQSKIILDGSEVSLRRIYRGMRAQFRVNPSVNESWYVSLKKYGTSYRKSKINSFTHNAVSVLSPGSIVTFIMRGDSRGTATFTIPGIAVRRPMKEKYSGLYEGSYTVRSNDYSTRVIPYGTLTIRGRTTTRKESLIPIIIQTGGGYYPIGTLSTPTITRPNYGDRVGSRFYVQGKAAPNATVYIEVEESLKYKRSSDYLEKQKKKVKSDSFGNFHTRFNFVLKPRGIDYIIRVYQQDQQGRRSPVNIIKVKSR